MAETAQAQTGSSPKSAKSPPKSSPKSPASSPPAEASNTQEAPIIEVAEGHDEYDEDGDSALEDDAASSAASVSSSILEYRRIKGRTYHSDRHQSNYFTPNDDQQMESQDITHHYLMVLLDHRLFLAPIGENPQKVLDVGTGSGIWAIDFADQFPQAEVTGTDLSPCQPSWVPPNVKFELDDCTKEWAWDENTFDFVHMRYLFGAIGDWTELFRQAYRVLTPGSWVQSGEAEVTVKTDDGSLSEDSALSKYWSQLYIQGGKKLGLSFTVLSDNLQRKGLEEAGFVDIQEVNYKLPIGGWPKDPKLAEVGRFAQLTLNNDIEGYTLMLWNNVLQWPTDEYQLVLMMMRKELNDKKIHGYMSIRYMWGRKPE